MIVNSIKFLRNSFVLSLLSSIALPQFAVAEEEMETIVVTARNVEESLQDVPSAVTTIGEDAIDAFRIDEASDLVTRIPALNISIGGSGSGAQITLRGVGSSFISNAFDSAVALNYDGISVSTQRLLQSAFFDVEQIALLKGPQSLYFGKAASAGVLSLRSANPTDEWDYGFKSSYETQEEGTTIGGYVSGPLSDTFGVRLAAEVQEIDEFVEIAAGNPTARPERGLENFISRVTFNWEPNEDLVANLKLNYNEQRSDSLNSNLDIFCGGDGLPDPSVILGGAFGGTPGIDLFAPTHDCDIGDGKFVGPDGHPLINSVPTGSPGEGRNVSLAYNDTDTFFGRLQVDYSLTDTLGLTALVGYVDLDNEYNDTFNSTGQNPDGSAAGLPAPFRNTLKQKTFELRLVSNLDGAFNYQAGVFWEDRDIGHTTSQNAFNPTLLGPLAPITGLPLGPDPVTGFTFDWLANRPIDADAVSVFVSAEYQISDQWQISGGVRWTDEEKSTSVGFPFIHAGVAALGLTAISSGFQTGDVDFEDDNVSPELVLTYRVSDDISIYGAYKAGFKSGGIDNNTLPTGALVLNLNDPDPAVREASANVLRFESEESDGFEVGFRSLLLESQLTLNVTAYRYVYENQQVQNFDPAIFAFDTTNAGEVTTQGVDVDFFWDTDIPGLSLSGSWAFLDSELTGDLLVSNGANLKGREAGFSPDFSGNIAINYETMLGDNLGLRISPNFAYKGEYTVGGASRDNFDPITNPLGDLLQDSYTQIDLNVSLFTADQKWRLSLIGRNLTDEQYFTFAGPAPFRPATGDDQLVGFGRGRQVFAEVAYNF